MGRQGLIIGIDNTNEYCQACYYSAKHGRPESISDGTEVMRYLIPTSLCYNSETNTWLTGSAAQEYAQSTGTYLFRDFLGKMLTGDIVNVGEKVYKYEDLLDIFTKLFLESDGNFVLQV